MNDCPVCGVEYDERVRDGRQQTIETGGPRRVCADFRYDKHNYGRTVVYVHEPATDNATEPDGGDE